MLKLKTIIDLRENIRNQIVLLERLSDDYLQLIDDDLYDVDMTAVPSFTTDNVLTGGELMITFTTQRQLKQKYMLRFCDDFGLTFISQTQGDNHYTYTFKCKE